MIPFLREQGVAVAMPAANIDTDVIMPKTFLKGIDRRGLAVGVFHDLRFDEDGQIRPGFALNQCPDARFLLVGPNFGCGSSREHAVWGLLQFGLRAIIGSSFAGIFADNAANNGLLLVTIAPEALDPLIQAVEEAPKRLTLDLEEQRIEIENRTPIAFDIDPMRRRAVMLGLDRIGETLQHMAGIQSFQEAYFTQNPWLINSAEAYSETYHPV